MIVKNDKMKYRVNYVNRGVGVNGKHWTRFSIGDYDKKNNATVYFTVMWFGDEANDLQDGDEVVFKDYQVGGNKYKGKDQVTIFINDGDIEIVSLGNDVVIDASAGELPW